MKIVHFHFYGAEYRGRIVGDSYIDCGKVCVDIQVINDDGSDGAIIMGVAKSALL